MIVVKRFKPQAVDMTIRGRPCKGFADRANIGDDSVTVVAYMNDGNGASFIAEIPLRPDCDAAVNVLSLIAKYDTENNSIN